MSIDAATLSILWPAFIAGLLVTATHVPLGMQVLDRGIVFIDLAIAQVAGVGVILALWFGMRERLGRIGFYVLFGCAVTVAVQLVGLFLVFTTLVVPALATFYDRQHRYLKAYSIGVLGYAAGLLVSALADLPSGAMIVCAITIVGAMFALATGRRTQSSPHR